MKMSVVWGCWSKREGLLRDERQYRGQWSSILKGSARFSVVCAECRPHLSPGDLISPSLFSGVPQSHRLSTRWNKMFMQIDQSARSNKSLEEDSPRPYKSASFFSNNNGPVSLGCRYVELRQGHDVPYLGSTLVIKKKITGEK